MKYLIAFLLYVIAFGWIGVLAAFVAFAVVLDIAAHHWPWVLALVLVVAAVDAIPVLFKSRKEKP